MNGGQVRAPAPPTAQVLNVQVPSGTLPQHHPVPGQPPKPNGRVAMISGGPNIGRTTQNELKCYECPTTYNVILGCPTLVDFGAITSIGHMCLKFPTQVEGVGTVRGNQGETRKMLYVATQQATFMVQGIGNAILPNGQDELDPLISFETVLEPMEEIEEVGICDQDPTKVIRLGKGLGPNKRNEIISPIKESTDVFAWCHGDMTGISPHVITHVLNVNKEMPLVQQKRSHLDLVKLEAFEKGVDKMLLNTFIKDVYYLEWLANPFLVPNRTEHGEYALPSRI
uniref:Uncharacterized protein n=1 Tax=Cannabis sativa TaxID=3483 RepID=A0A803Q0M5_CANSA